MCNIEKLLPFNVLKSELTSSKPFWYTGTTNEGELANFAEFALKLGSMHERSQKGQILNLRSNTYHMVKIW